MKERLKGRKVIEDKYKNGVAMTGSKTCSYTTSFLFVFLLSLLFFQRGALLIKYICATALNSNNH